MPFKKTMKFSSCCIDAIFKSEGVHEIVVSNWKNGIRRVTFLDNEGIEWECFVRWNTFYDIPKENKTDELIAYVKNKRKYGKKVNVRLKRE